MSFGVNASVKRAFFDRQAVISAIGEKNAKALSKAGAFTQRRARSSMRRRKKASPPGSPPSAHTASGDVRSLKNIWFAYEESRQSVVVGPLKLNGEQGSVPALHEFGGSRTVEVMFYRGKWRVVRNGFVEVDGKSIAIWNIPGGKFRPRKFVQAVYPPRPYMRPALIAEAPKFPELWASV
jgi:hypothetical protein